MKEVADERWASATPSPDPGRCSSVPMGEKAPGVKTVPDPYFGGAGPARTGCIECGECMTGCRHGAKTPLVKELPGARGKGWRTGHSDDDGDRCAAACRRGLECRAVRTGRWVRKHTSTFTADHVILAAGTWGTRSCCSPCATPAGCPLSDRLGLLTRTNSESIVGAARYQASPSLDLTHGVAITSSIHPDSGHPTSNRCVTGRAPTRWVCCRP